MNQITVKELIAQGKEALRTSGCECNEADVEMLMGHVLEMDRAELFLGQDSYIAIEAQELYKKLVSRIARGEPPQYVMGEAFFMGHRFIVDTSVLIPRPETEILCDMAISGLRAFEGTPAVLDLCTGSGTLAVSIALAVENAKVYASDISEGALSVARKNANALGVSARISFLKSDLFENFYKEPSEKEPSGQYDMIVTNPPYIRESDLRELPNVVRLYEPLIALDGGADGLDFYNRIGTEAGAFMNPCGVILAEIGADQGAQVKAAFEAAGFSDVSVSKDLAGRDRVVRAVKR